MKKIKIKYSEFIKEGMRPKSNLEVGDFLINYYHGTDNETAGTIYRIHHVGHSDYSAFEISHHDSKTMSRAISDDEIIGTESYRGGDGTSSWGFIKTDISFVKSLIEDVVLSEIINEMAKKDQDFKYYESLSMADLSNKYVVRHGGALTKLVRIYSGHTEIKLEYDPLMDFPGDFGGRKPVNFD